MAVKKTYSKKTVVEEPVMDTPTVEPATEETVTAETDVKQPKKYANDDGILCESITAGELGMIGAKSGNNYTWMCYGDTTEVEYADLVAAIRLRKGHIFAPLFIIRDEDFLAKYPQVNDVYNSMYTTSDLEDIFMLPAAQMKEVIKSLPFSVQKTIANMASAMITDGRLDSVQKIKVLDELFDTKLMLITELLD
ncbi:hypothetical protein [Holdemanella biformis]|uniref:hypothetical protein n=1 Tax=Holdemanella biformis TaxID=1735 RepID=UPI002492CC40|nr:hypothetical protein [Holdemanella biformis]